MVHNDRDPLNGASRDAVLISKEDADRLGFANGDPIRLRRNGVHFDGRAFLAPIKPGNLQVHWPEGNVLVPKETLRRRVRSPRLQRDRNCGEALLVLPGAFHDLDRPVAVREGQIAGSVPDRAG